MMTPTALIQQWIQEALRRTLGLHVHRKPPFGTDVLAEVRGLRNWAPGDVIFDVGANNGRTVSNLQRYFQSWRIDAFEPVAETFQRLVSCTAGLENVRSFQFAMGASSGAQTIYTGSRSVLNSFSPSGWEPSGTALVDVATVDRFMAEHGIERIDFLKIDTEGHDLEVLRGAEAALAVGRIGIIQVEAGFHQHSRAVAGLDEMRCYLATHDYSLFGIFNQRRTPRGPRAQAQPGGVRSVPNVLAHCDALFVSNELVMRQFGP